MAAAAIVVFFIVVIFLSFLMFVCVFYGQSNGRYPCLQNEIDRHAMVIDKQRFTDHRGGIDDLQVICEGFIGYKPGLIGCEAVIVGIWCRSRVSAPVSLKYILRLPNRINSGIAAWRSLF
jgi:hypothetical protein